MDISRGMSIYTIYLFYSYTVLSLDWIFIVFHFRFKYMQIVSYYQVCILYITIHYTLILYYTYLYSFQIFLYSTVFPSFSTSNHYSMLFSFLVLCNTIPVRLMLYYPLSRFEILLHNYFTLLITGKPSRWF